MQLPMGLVTALETGNCVLFVGAGAGFEMQKSSGDHAPTGVELADAIATHFAIDTGGVSDLGLVAQVAENRHGRARLISCVERLMSGYTPSEHFQWLTSLTWRAIFTTNYDDAIQECYRRNPDPTQTPVTMAANADFRSWNPHFEVPVFHLHGSLSAAEKDMILITQRDYAEFRSKRQMLFDHFRLSFAGTPILYFGYSNRDPNWQMVTTEVRAEYSPSSPPPSYRIDPSTPDLEREVLADQGITTLDCDLKGFRSAVELALGNIRVEPSRLDDIKASVPPDLQELFGSSPAAVSRLINTWDYVNQADFSAPPNTQDFFKGDRPIWALLGQGISFERDLESPIVERLVDFATDPKPRVRCEIVLGPAGYGTTTLLMAVAAWFAQNRIGRTFFLRPGMSVSPGDVEFAAQSTDGPVIFIVDNAADHVEALGEVTELLQNLRVPAFLLLGERLNEWRQRRPRFNAFEHLIEPLSDGEIDRLLDALAARGALGNLAPLDRALQFAAVKTKNQQELLVTMREVTEGRAFDAIIEDEYRSIADGRAKELYGLICAFSRSRALVRDALCADALGIRLVDMYPLLSTSLEGIARWETIDEARGLEALRARHQIIADIVWDRCLDRLERERFLMAAIDSLNLTFGLDAKAFESFTRDDEAVDSLQTLEAKIRFFEEACRRDPRNPYVRQHYARMLRREGKVELALSQIDTAVAMAPGKRVLQHTRGVILHDAALSAGAQEVARRRLAQAEDAFNSAIRAAPRDEYAYQSLTELYLDWARQVGSVEESIEYTARAQEVVSSGLNVVRNREGLYVASSKIEEFLGDAAARLDALHNALAAAPGSPTVRYLLGNALRRRGELPQAIEVLEHGLREHPDDPNLAWALAMAEYQETGTYDRAIAVMSLARLKGERQPRFVATYGGMLVMSGHPDEAADVWRRAAEREFSVQDRSKAFFVPEDGGVHKSIEGIVRKVGPGYAFIGATGLPDFYCRSSRLSGVVLRPGLSVVFTPGFAVRGPQAVAVSSGSEV